MVLPEQSTAQHFDEGRVQLCIAIGHVKTAATIAIATSAAVSSGPAGHVLAGAGFTDVESLSVAVHHKSESI